MNPSLVFDGIRRLAKIQQTLILSIAIGFVAFLYSSVGHGGASGYIAVMTFFSVLPSDIKPTALVLNILVSSIGAVQFWHAGHFSWSLFWPFALLAVPAAYAGGFVQLPIGIFNPLLGFVLLVSAVRLTILPTDPPNITPPPRGIALALGAGIGLLSGLTGTGGGIFLTPLILFCRWATIRQAAAVTAMFILVNSVSGLVGHINSGKPIPSFVLWLAFAAVAGGAWGSHLGSNRLSVHLIHLFLSAALVFAGIKLLITH